MIRIRIPRKEWYSPDKSSIQPDALRRIIHLRRLLLLHSYIYYELNDNIVSDHQWQSWADELTRFQIQYGHKAGFYDICFTDWDGSTGCHLIADPNVVRKAMYLLRRSKSNIRVA
jgi:hypothetical protein